MADPTTDMLIDSFFDFPDYEFTIRLDSQRVARMLFSFQVHQQNWHVTLQMNPTRFEAVSIETSTVKEGFDFCQQLFSSRISPKRSGAIPALFQRAQPLFITLMEQHLQNQPTAD